jgi:hypothetical protein
VGSTTTKLNISEVPTLCRHFGLNPTLVCRPFHWPSSSSKIQIFWDVTPCREATTYQPTRLHIPEGLNLQRRCENSKQGQSPVTSRAMGAVIQRLGSHLSVATRAKTRYFEAIRTLRPQSRRRRHNHNRCHRRRRHHHHHHHQTLTVQICSFKLHIQPVNTIRPSTKHEGPLPTSQMRQSIRHSVSHTVGSYRQSSTPPPI